MVPGSLFGSPLGGSTIIALVAPVESTSGFLITISLVLELGNCFVIWEGYLVGF